MIQVSTDKLPVPPETGGAIETYDGISQIP